MGWSSQDIKQAWGSRSGLRVFLLAVVSIFVVGLLTSYLIASSVIEREERQSRERLVSVAQVAALAIDTVQYERMVRADQQDSPAYRAQISKLAQVLRQLPDVRFIYTIRRVGTDYFFILDPTPPGDFDHDGVEDKSYVMDPVPTLDRELVECYETGLPTVTEEPLEDPWGLFITAYVPLINSEGDVISVVGVDRDYADVYRISDEVRRYFYGAVILSFAVALLLGGLVSRQSGGIRSDEVGPIRRLFTRRVFTLTLAEISLYTLVALTVGTSLFCLGEVKADERALAVSGTQDQAIQQAQGVYDVAMAGVELKDAQLESRLHGLRKAGYDNLARELAVAIRTSSGLQDLPRVGKKLRVERSLMEILRANLMKRMAARMGWAFTFAAVAVLVSVSGALMLRHATQQDLVLRQTTRESHQAQTTYSRLVEALPIGLFAFRDTGFIFANFAWRQMIGAADDESAWLAFLNSMNDLDRGATEALLRRQASRREKFLLAVRVQNPAGEWRHLEIHAAPVADDEGEYEYMLAFVLDRTETVVAGEALVARNEELREALSTLEGNLDSTVRLLVRIVEAKDRYTAGHSERVAAFSVAIGRRLGISDADLRILELGALIHDVGKIGIPDAVLNKPGSLTDEEYGIVKSHPEVGHLMIRDMAHFSGCAPLVLQHHERLDGSGYPNGMHGPQLSHLVRILMVADAYDAMTSSRAYRRGLSARVAVTELMKDANAGKVDPEVVRCLAETIDQGLPPFDGFREESAA